jgi:hypothetical protein
VVSLVCPCCPWLVLTPRVLQLCTNHFVWVMCRPMWRPVWVSEACQFFLVPSWSSNMPLYPSKCCELGSVPRFLLLLLFPTWAHIWVFWRVGGAPINLVIALNKWQKTINHKKFHAACIFTLVVAYHLRLQGFFIH